VLDPGRGRTKTGQLWAYARDDRPWAAANRLCGLRLCPGPQRPGSRSPTLQDFKGLAGRRLWQPSHARRTCRYAPRLLLVPCPRRFYKVAIRGSCADWQRGAQAHCRALRDRICRHRRAAEEWLAVRQDRSWATIACQARPDARRPSLQRQSAMPCPAGKDEPVSSTNGHIEIVLAPRQLPA